MSAAVVMISKKDMRVLCCQFTRTIYLYSQSSYCIEIGLSLIFILSLMLQRCGDVNTPTFRPADCSIDPSLWVTEPFPLVPATWKAGWWLMPKWRRWFLKAQTCSLTVLLGRLRDCNKNIHSEQRLRKRFKSVPSSTNPSCYQCGPLIIFSISSSALRFHYASFSPSTPSKNLMTSLPRASQAFSLTIFERKSMKMENQGLSGLSLALWKREVRVQRSQRGVTASRFSNQILDEPQYMLFKLKMSDFNSQPRFCQSRSACSISNCASKGVLTMAFTEKLLFTFAEFQQGNFSAISQSRARSLSSTVQSQCSTRSMSLICEESLDWRGAWMRWCWARLALDLKTLLQERQVYFCFYFIQLLLCKNFASSVTIAYRFGPSCPALTGLSATCAHSNSTSSSTTSNVPSANSTPHESTSQSRRRYKTPIGRGPSQLSQSERPSTMKLPRSRRRFWDSCSTNVRSPPTGAAIRPSKTSRDSRSIYTESTESPIATSASITTRSLFKSSESTARTSSPSTQGSGKSLSEDFRCTTPIAKYKTHKFCKKSFYDEQKIVVHLKQEHQRCDLCPPEFKATYYYQNYFSLEKHFDLTHYLCKDQICRNERYRVFSSKGELESHIAVVHLDRKSSKNSLDHLLSFKRVEPAIEDFRLKDREGVDFKQQMPSLKMHVYERIDRNLTHSDEPIDFRDFSTQAINNLSLNNQRLIFLMQKKAKKRLDQIQALDVFIPLGMPILKHNQFYFILKEVFDEGKCDSVQDILKRQTLPQASKLFKLVDRKFDHQSSVYYVFPLIIRAFGSDQDKLQMDKFYRQELKRSGKTSIEKFKYATHGQFLRDLLKVTGQVIKQKIEKRQISLSDYFKGVEQNHRTFVAEDFNLQRQKLVQIIHIVSRTPTKQMVKFKWLLKFGLSIETWDNIVHSDYDPALFEHVCRNLPHKHLAILYYYIRLCCLAISSKAEFATEKDQKNVNFLASLLKSNNHLLKQEKIPQANLNLGRDRVFLVQRPEKCDEDQFPSLEPAKKKGDLPKKEAFPKKETSNKQATNLNQTKKKPPDQLFPSLPVDQVKPSKPLARPATQKRQQRPKPHVPDPDFPTFQELYSNQPKAKAQKEVEKVFMKSEEELQQQRQRRFEQLGGVILQPKKKLQDEKGQKKSKRR